MLKSVFCTSIGLLLAAGTLHAQDGSEHPIFNENWIIKLGAQHSDADARMGLANSDIGEIPLIDIGEGDANTSINSVGTSIVWQAPDRWSFGFSYFLARVEGDSLTSEDITFGELLIPEGTGIRSDFETDFFILNAFYDFYQAPGRSAGIGLGIYALNLSLAVETVVAGQPTGETAGADTLAPLPTISAYYKHAINKQWAWSASAGYFGAEIDKYDGKVLAADLSIEYWPSENWGLGAGYTFVDLDVTVDETVFDQRYIVEYDSFFVFASFGF